MWWKMSFRGIRFSIKVFARLHFDVRQDVISEKNWQIPPPLGHTPLLVQQHKGGLLLLCKHETMDKEKLYKLLWSWET